MPIEQTRRVLIVDDDSDIRLLLATALRQKDLEIEEATNGAHAIELLKRNHYPVVLLDLMMPEVDGFGVLEAIRNDVTPQPVVLVISGASRQLLDKVDTTRIHGIVRKPFDPLEVAAIVAACVELGPRTRFDAMTVASVLSSSALIGWLAR